MSPEEELLKRLYERFHARDLESALAAMQEGGVWANGMEGEHVYGREGIREYWTRKWTLIDPHVEPVKFTIGPEGEVVAPVNQIVPDLNENQLADTSVGRMFN